MSDPITPADLIGPAVPTFSPDPKRQSWLRRHWLVIALVVVTFVIGIAIGGAGKTPAAVAESEPQPTKTVTVTKEVEVPGPAVADLSCRRAAQEMFSLLESSHNEVAMPMMEVSRTLYSYIVGDAGLSDIERATGTMEGVTATMETNTSRIEAIGPDYRACVAG